LRRQHRIELLGTCAVARHPHVEGLLNFEVLDVTQGLGKPLPVVDESGNDDAVRSFGRPQPSLFLAREHVAQLLGAPHARQIITRPERYQDPRRAERDCKRHRPGGATFELAIDVNVRLASKLEIDAKLQERQEVVGDPVTRLRVPSVADEDIVLVGHDIDRPQWRNYHHIPGMDAAANRLPGQE